MIVEVVVVDLIILACVAFFAMTVSKGERREEKDDN